MQEIRLPRWFQVVLVAVLVAGSSTGLLIDARSFGIELASGLVSFAVLILIGAPLIGEVQRIHALDELETIEVGLRGLSRQCDLCCELLSSGPGGYRDRLPALGDSIDLRAVRSHFPDLATELVGLQLELESAWPTDAHTEDLPIIQARSKASKLRDACERGISRAQASGAEVEARTLTRRLLRRGRRHSESSDATRRRLRDASRGGDADQERD